ncbi:MAG: asparagine--tRNA ligase [Fibrobacterota bacterium]
MKRNDIATVLSIETLPSQIKAAGWIRTMRSSRNRCFIELNDGSCLHNLQIIAERDAMTDYDDIAALKTGSAVVCEGVLRESPARGQRVELAAQSVLCCGGADNSYPLQKKRHSLEFLRQIPHLRPRTNTIGAVMRVRSVLAQRIHRFFEDRGFVYVNTPVITASDCEGAGELFQVTTRSEADFEKNKDDYQNDFFKQKAYLTVSGQLEGEIYATALSKVYTFGPTFRAENSHTSRHLSEFWMVEPEVAFCTLSEIMDLAEEFLSALIAAALEKCLQDLSFFNQRIDTGLLDRLRTILRNGFSRLSYDEAVTLLSKNNDNFDTPVAWGDDLQTEHERFLTEKLSSCVIVYNYPAAIKPFYMKQNEDGVTVGAMDMLVPGIGELMGGSEREYRYTHLRNAMESAGISLSEYEWYLDLRRYGSVPHSGFGLGFERLVQFITGMKNIRDVIPFPRYPGSI